VPPRRLRVALLDERRARSLVRPGPMSNLRVTYLVPDSAGAEEAAEPVLGVGREDEEGRVDALDGVGPVADAVLNLGTDGAATR